MKYYMAQTKLPTQVEAQNTKKAGLRHSYTLFKEMVEILCI